MGTLLEEQYIFLITSSSVLRMRNVPDKLEETKTDILCSITFSKNCAIYEVMWKM